MNNLSERTARKSSTSGIYHTRAHTPMYIIQFWDFLRWKSALSTLIKSVLGSLVYVYIMVCVCALSAHRQIIVHVSRAFLIWGRREIIFNFDAYQRRNSQLCTHNNDNHLRCCFNAHRAHNDEMLQKGQGCVRQNPIRAKASKRHIALENHYIWLCPLSCAWFARTAAGQSHS